MEVRICCYDTICSSIRSNMTVCVYVFLTRFTVLIGCHVHSAVILWISFTRLCLNILFKWKRYDKVDQEVLTSTSYRLNLAFLGIIFNRGDSRTVTRVFTCWSRGVQTFPPERPKLKLNKLYNVEFYCYVTMPETSRPLKWLTLNLLGQCWAYNHGSATHSLNV